MGDLLSNRARGRGGPCGTGLSPRSGVDFETIEPGANEAVERIAAGGRSSQLPMHPGRRYRSPCRWVLIDFMNARCARMLLAAVVCLAGVTAGCGRRFNSPQPSIPAHQKPTISDISNQVMPEDVENEGLSRTVAFTVADPDTSLSQLRLSAFSSFPAVVPTNNIVFDGLGAERRVTIRPAPHAFGRITITIRVSDGESEGSRSFQLDVQPCNGCGLVIPSYYKRQWNESRADEHKDWGTSTWYLETVETRPTRQIQVYTNGTVLQYDPQHNEDAFGRLSEEALDVAEFAPFQISQAEFYELWRSQKPMNR
jgi:hypothetical protein